MGLIKDTLAHFFNKISKYLEHKFKERVWNKENQGAWAICEPWFTGSQALGDSHITMVHILTWFTYYPSAESGIYELLNAIIF
jgi:hypothetical protein